MSIFFFHTDSPTNAGGAALYINKRINAIHRPVAAAFLTERFVRLCF